jgi:anti-anti-sigma factor
MIEVQLIDLPVAVHRRAAEHLADLRRELELMDRADNEARGLPPGLHDAARTLDFHIGDTGDALRAALDDAEERGDARVTLQLDIAPELAESAQHILDLLDQLDDHCRSGDLLITLATPPEALSYRRWFFGQFVDQAAGKDPAPWTEPGRGEDGAVAPLSEPAPESRLAPAAALPEGWSIDEDDHVCVIRLQGALDLATAPALRATATPLADRDLHLDLRLVDFIDSIGLSVLLAVRRRLSEDEHHLTLDPSTEVRRVLELAGVDGLFAGDAD